jgi:CelD/BcsL family acetyltransferase involved in cellulose biosynthesis
MIEVHEVNQIDALAEFRSAWRELLAQTPAASFFQSLEWLECYWRHFGGDQKLRVLVASDCRQPVGILPLVVRRETTRVGRLRILTYLLHDWATFYGPIGPCATTTLTAGLRHVRATPRDWDVLDLRWIDADGGDLGRTERAMAQAGFPSQRQKWDSASLVELPEAWQEYWQGREPKFRKNIDRLQRRMAEQGRVQFVRCRSAAPMPVDDGASPAKAGPACRAGLDRLQDLLEASGPTAVPCSVVPSGRRDLQSGTPTAPYETCVALAQRSWQGDGVPACGSRVADKTNLCHDQFGRFFREAHAAAAECGAADINLLYFDGQPAAFAYNYCWNGAVYGLRKGFDPRFAHLRPGLVLQKLMLEDGHGRGDRGYDLGTGDVPSKSPWRTSLRANYRFTHFPAAVFRAQLLWWNRWLRRRLLGERDVACST